VTEAVVLLLHATALLPGKNPGTHLIGDCVDSRAYLDILESKKFSPCQDSNRGLLRLLGSVYTDGPTAALYF